ncbi:hypothetical protein AML33_24530, partial [Escherichia coli]
SLQDFRGGSMLTGRSPTKREPILYIPGNCAASCQTIFRGHNIYRQPEIQLMKLRYIRQHSNAAE